MTTITRTPTREDLACLVCKAPGPALDIDHIQAKGMGGSKERDVPKNKAPMCRPCHDAKHRRVLQTRVTAGVFMWRRKGSAVWITVPVAVNERYGCLDFSGDPVLSAAADGEGEAGRGTYLPPSVLAPDGEGPASSPPPSAAAPSAGGPLAETGITRNTTKRSIGVSRKPLSPLDGCCQRLMLLSYQYDRLESATDEWKWQVGECMNDLERIVGAEEVNGYLRGFRKEKTLMQYAWVAAKVTRVIGLSWSHHRAVAALPPSEQQERLEEAKAAGTPAEGLRLALRAPRERHSCPDCGADHQVKS